MTRINEKLQLPITKKGDPLKPLNPGSDACRVDRPRRQTARREVDGSTIRTTERVVNNPCGGIKRREVCLEDELEFADGGLRIGEGEGGGEVGDGMRKGAGETGGGGGRKDHDDGL